MNEKKKKKNTNEKKNVLKVSRVREKENKTGHQKGNKNLNDTRFLISNIRCQQTMKQCI